MSDNFIVFYISMDQVLTCSVRLITNLQCYYVNTLPEAAPAATDWGGGRLKGIMTTYGPHPLVGTHFNTAA